MAYPPPHPPAPARRRPPWPLLVAAAAVALLVLVAAALWAIGRADGSLTRVRGVVGSEKVPFFEDERVRSRLAELGYEVTVRPLGSRAIAEAIEEGEDFGSPGSTPSTEHFKEVNGVEEEYRPFSTPMVLLSYEPIAEALAEAGVAAQESDGTWSFDMQAYLDLTEERTRWRDLPGDSVSGSNRNELLIRTTDPRTSNSAAMHLVVLSYLLNDEEIVQGTSVDDDMAATLSRLFLAQGQPPDSSQQPFEHYRDLGPGHTPLVWAYEFQYIAAAVHGPALPEDAVVMYPSPTVFSTHTILPVTEQGSEVGRLLTEDEGLQALAADYGFRTEDTERFEALVSEHALPIREQVGDVVHEPAYRTVEALIGRIEQEYSDSGQPAPAADRQPGPGGPGGPLDDRRMP
ncbi:hypothetical protein [Nocardiopsis sp. NRRL B-16309]|uniref:hypothetical protein n=1 Tax=Nocardiopsis sp. NRRL B-16309 TaxID=1519494 RepID=UPI0006ADA2BB|nr:hypothetical protein [Nocardiopsis sp. NRRL B-16309]KOX18083.1 hypothetical protein ADL05_08235 [Nocardiopsis sp. NRRL B-16309]